MRTEPCCESPRLKEIKHPIYRCQKCRAKIQLVKVEYVEARVIDESSEQSKTA